MVGVPPAGAAVGVVQVSALTTTAGCSRMSDGTVTAPASTNRARMVMARPARARAGHGAGRGWWWPAVERHAGRDRPEQLVRPDQRRHQACWGGNAFGQLGDGTKNQRSTPVQVKNPAGSGPLTGVVSLTTGYYHTCALLTDKSVDCWGDNGYYQLGNNSNAQSSLPVKVKNGRAPRRSGRCQRLGRAIRHLRGHHRPHRPLLGHQQLRPARHRELRPTPLPKPVRNGKNTANLASVIQLSAGPSSTCAVLSSKTIKNEVRCWGDNQFGQLGTNNHTSTNKPVAVKAVTGTANLQNILQVSTNGGANGDHTCARTKGSTAVCWGSNNYGQLGNGTKTPKLRPVVIKNGAGTATLGGVSQVLSGITSSCAVVSGQQARCWGFNSSGQFGNGGAHDTLRPVVANP